MSKATALIVDDERDIRELLCLALGRMDLSTHAAGTLQDAKTLLAAQPFDICLTDMRLPDGSGLDVLRRMKSDPKMSGIPVLVLTGHGEKDVIVESMAAGACDFIVKPFKPDHVLEVAQKALSKSDD